MGPINTGPAGCWYAAFALVIIGALAVCGAAFWLVWWLFQRLTWS